MRDSFIFYRSFYEATKILPAKKRLKIYEMIIELGLNCKKIEEKDELIKSLFTLIEPQIVSNNKKYESGKRGGRPRKTDTSLKTNGFENKKTNGFSEKKANENVNDNDNENVNDNDYKSPTTPTNNNKSGETIFDVVQREFGRVLSPIELEILNEWLAKNYSEELILYAVREAILNNAKSLKYVQRILERLESQGIKTVSEAQTGSHRFVSEAQNVKNKKLFDYDWLNDDGDEENEI